jgi:F0F1-type ATP synthase assembly protein I
VKGDWRNVFLAFSFVSFVSSTLIGSLALGYFAGKWVDDEMAAYPAGRIGGLALGLAMAVWTIVRHLRDNFIKISEKK